MSEEIKLLRDKLAFTEKEADCLRDALFTQKAKNRKYYKKITELETKLDVEVKKAKTDTAKTIFTEMYKLVCDAEDCTIIVTANDIKKISKLYGVNL